MNKKSLVGLLTLGIIGIGTMNYQASEINEKLERLTIVEQSSNTTQTQKLAQLMQQGFMEGKEAQSVLKSVTNQMKQAQRATMTYTVTEEQSEDGYFKTINQDGQETWLSNIEIENMNLKKGDRVEIVVNQYGELVALTKLQN